ncbi:MAG TPA: hypothetical protein VN648_22280, partial [Candidatus Methylomirabilis sp.]|nr:hypothetical protein [Candidatus Methylomirabilis sp.]
MNEPIEDAIVTATTITVHGTVTDESAVTVRVQDHPVSVSNGEFTTDVSLHAGLNRIEVEAADALGNRTRLIRHVRFEDLHRTQALAPPILVAAGLPDLGHIAIAPDGTLLVTAPSAGRIYSVPFDGSPSRILFDSLRYPLGIATTQDGTIYIAEQGADRILRISPDGTKVVVLDEVEDPRGLTLGNEGELFVTASGGPKTGRDHGHDAHHGQVLRLELGTGSVSVVADGLVRPEGIVASQENQNEILWVSAERRQGESEWQDADMFRITLTGTATPIPGPNLRRPTGLARDILGNLWLSARRQYSGP